MNRTLASFLSAALLAGTLNFSLASLASAQGAYPGGGPGPAEIWLCPQSLMPAPLASDLDFLDLFQPEAPWTFAAAHTQVFKLYSSFLTRARQDQVNLVIQDLNRRHIAIALEVGVMNVGFKPPPPCGGFGLIEGYGTVAQARRICAVVKAAGGEIKYLDMDEPLYYGHFSSKPHTCHSPIGLVVEEVVPTLNVYLEAFPNLIIGETEPTRFPAYADWQAGYETWAKDFAAAMNRPLAFVHLDIPWTDDGKHVPGTNRDSHEPGDALTFYGLLQRLERQGLIGGIGIIFDGTPNDATDLAWVQDAQAHARLLVQENQLRPDQVIFQSWMPRPSHALPETNADTLTSLIDWYFSTDLEK